MKQIKEKVVRYRCDKCGWIGWVPDFVSLKQCPVCGSRKIRKIK